MDLLDLAGGCAEGDRARHVGVVAGEPGAEVELDHVALLQQAVAGLVVRLGGVLAEGDDRVERQPVGALVQHQRLELPGDLLLADPDREGLQDARRTPRR